jgi:hypothetical protein
VWALGYYLPTYRLIHAIPVLGSVRCPARMLLGVDMALASLAAMTVHSLATRPPADLAGTVRRWSRYYLPIGMAGSIIVVGLLGLGDRWGWWPAWAVVSGPPESIRQALNPLSPAIYVPVALAAVTIVVVTWHLRRPRRRAWCLIALLLADLFVITRFVDVPGADRPAPDPADSPAARWLRAHGPDEPFRVWGLSTAYYHRPAELLLPKTNGPLGIESISSYGPLPPAEHAMALGFRPWGENPQWEWLIRRNHLLSLYNVRYVLAADPRFRRVIESVRIPDAPAPPDGPNLLTDRWSTVHAELRDGVLRLRAPWRLAPARAWQQVRLVPGRVYRIAMDVRAPGKAGHLVVGRFVRRAGGLEAWRDPSAALRVDYEQFAPRWRHFERTFRYAGPAAEGDFEVQALGRGTLEVANVSLRRSSWPVPINLGGRLAAGEAVYRDVTPDGLDPARPGDARVHVYENRVCLPRSFPAEAVGGFPDNLAVIEELRWRADGYDLTRQALSVGPGPARFVSDRQGLARAGWSAPVNGLTPRADGAGWRWVALASPIAAAVAICALTVALGRPKPPATILEE